MNTIIIPTDFSEISRHGIDYGLMLARKYNSKIILLNVWNLPQTNSSMIISISDIIKQNAENSIFDLKKELTLDSQNKTLEIETIIKMGDISEEVKALAKKRNADLIIMGTEGAEGFLENIIGTNAGGVIADAPCPVMAIPKKAVMKFPKKIAIATNYGINDIKWTRKIIEWFSPFNCKIHLVHIGDPEEKDLKEYEDFSIEASTQLPNEVELNYLAEKDVIEGLQNYLNKNKIDIIAMSTRRHNFLQLLFNRSMTRQIVLNTNIPLLAFQHESTIEASLEEIADMEQEMAN